MSDTQPSGVSFPISCVTQWLCEACPLEFAVLLLHFTCAFRRSRILLLRAWRAAARRLDLALPHVLHLLPSAASLPHRPWLGAVPMSLGSRLWSSRCAALPTTLGGSQAYCCSPGRLGHAQPAITVFWFCVPVMHTFASQSVESAVAPCIGRCPSGIPLAHLVCRNHSRPCSPDRCE